MNNEKHGARKRKRAQVLLLTREGYNGEIIAERAGMSCRAIESLRQRFVDEGLDVTLKGKACGRRSRTLNG